MSTNCTICTRQSPLHVDFVAFPYARALALAGAPWRALPALGPSCVTACISQFSGLFTGRLPFALAVKRWKSSCVCLGHAINGIIAQESTVNRVCVYNSLCNSLLQHVHSPTGACPVSVTRRHTFLRLCQRVPGGHDHTTLGLPSRAHSCAVRHPRSSPRLLLRLTYLPVHLKTAGCMLPSQAQQCRDFT